MDFATISGYMSHLSSFCILDSRDPYQMRSRRKLFATYQLVNEETVFTAMDQSGMVISVIAIKVKCTIKL